MAAERGLVMRLPPAQTRTRRAHETAAFARAEGAFERAHVALFRAFFEHGLDLDDSEVLATVVHEAGLDREQLRLALGTRAFAEIVDADVALAARLRIRSVPVMIVADGAGRGEPVLGAVGFELLEAAINRALARQEIGG